MVGREEGRFLVMRIQEILILAGEEEDRGIGGDEEEGERGENERRGGGWCSWRCRFCKSRPEAAGPR